MRAYRIRNWDEHFEKAGSRKVKALSWVALPNRFDGAGYARVMSYDDGLAIFGAWVVIVELASRMPHRGLLIKDDRPLEAADIATRARVDAVHIQRALDVLTTEEIGWIEVIEYEPRQHADSTCLAASSVLPARDSVLSPRRHDMPDTGQDRTGPDPTEQDRTKQDTADAVSNFSILDGPGRNGAVGEMSRFRNTFVLEVVQALKLDSRRALANRRPLLAVARKIEERADRDEFARGLVEVAVEKGSAGLDNPAAAWQAVVNERLDE